MTVKLTELAKYLMDRNGQYILGDFSQLKWNLSSFWEVMRAEIDNYAGYNPLQKKFNITCNGQLHYDFTHDPHNVGYTISDPEAEPPIAYVPGIPPKFLTSVVPVSTMTLLSTLAGFVSPMSRDAWNPSRLVEPRPFIWEYRKPILTFTETGTFDITANYPYEYIKEYDDENNLIEVTIPKIDEDDNYIFLQEVLSGRFLITIGRSRRAFTYTDMPIITDADKLVQEGLAEYENGTKEIYAFHHWYDAIRP